MLKTVLFRVGIKYEIKYFLNFRFIWVKIIKNRIALNKLLIRVKLASTIKSFKFSEKLNKTTLFNKQFCVLQEVIKPDVQLIKFMFHIHPLITWFQLKTNP